MMSKNNANIVIESIGIVTLQKGWSVVFILLFCITFKCFYFNKIKFIEKLG